MASPLQLRQRTEELATSPDDAAAANQAARAVQKKTYSPQNTDPQVFSKGL